MARIAKSRTPRWWNKHEGYLRKILADNPNAESMTISEFSHSVRQTIPQAELVELCKLIGIRLADMPAPGKPK